MDLSTLIQALSKCIRIYCWQQWTICIRWLWATVLCYVSIDWL